MAIRTILYFFLACIYGCTNHISMGDLVPHTNIVVDPYKEENRKFLKRWSQAIDSIDIIVLKDAVLSTELQILSDDAHFFVLDKKNSNIYCFDPGGNLLYKIDKRGRGPNEYLLLKNIALNSRAELGAFDPAKSNFMLFGPDGSITRNIPLRKGAENACFYNDSLILAICRYSRRMLDTDMSVSLIDMSGNYINQYLRLPDWGRNSFVNKTPFSNIFETPGIHFPLTRDIYSIKDGEIYCKYRIDFQERNVPDDLLNELGYTISQDYFKTLLSQKKHLDYINNFHESKNHVSFDYIDFSTSKTILCLYDKRNGEVYTSTAKGIWHLVMYRLDACSKNGKFISVIPVSSLFLLKKYYDKNKEVFDKESRFTIFIKKLNDFINSGMISEDYPNTVLTIVKFK